MTSNPGASIRLLGSLRSADGKGVVRMEERLDAPIDEVWQALTTPARLGRWYGEIEGDLRVGGEYVARVVASGWEGTGRIEACEPPQRLVVTGAEPDQQDRNGTEITLAADRDQTVLVLEQRGMPLEYLAAFGAGIQVHVEDLAAHLAGHERCDSDARMDELIPAYDKLAANLEGS